MGRIKGWPGWGKSPPDTEALEVTGLEDYRDGGSEEWGVRNEE